MSRSVLRRNTAAKARSKRPGGHFYAYRSTSRVDLLEARHPGLRALVESLLRRRVKQGEIAKQVQKRFGVRLSSNSISRYYLGRVQPQEHEEAAAYRQAHAQARALITEMKADPSLDASQIAELMLAQAIVRDRMKLAEADIMDLYKEQRERKKLELQSKALRLRERQVKGMIAKPAEPRREKQLSPETIQKIREIYGLVKPAPPPVTAP